MGRREGDRYYTPNWATQALLDKLPDLHGIKLYDPCCGDGRMAEQLHRAGRCDVMLLNDLDLAKTQAHRHQDATQDTTWLEAGAIDITVTNPPFGQAGAIAQYALRYTLRAVALLLRITWLEPCAGRTWLLECPPSEMIVLPRISFTGGGTDSATCAWFIWRRAHGRGTWQRGGIALAARQESAGQMPLQLPPREPWVGSDVDGERL